MHIIIGFAILVIVFACFPKTAKTFGAIAAIGFALFVLAGLLGAFR